MTTLQEAPPGALPVVEKARDVIFRYLAELGIECVFGVPGTNEIPIIDGTTVSAYGVRYVQCLHENIAMGAAMGYARMSGRPGVVELHATPGAGHGVGNLFNAFKSHVPLVVLCGQQHHELLVQEPLLASDLVQVAGQYTKWAYEARSPYEIALMMQRALKVAMAPPTGPVFLSIPWDYLIADVWPDFPPDVTRVAPGFVGDAAGVVRAADVLARAERPVVVVGDGVGYADAWDEIEELAALTGADVYAEQLSSLMNYPNHLYRWQGELPGTQQAIRATFEKHDVAFLCGFNAQAQLTVFNAEKGSLIPTDVRQVYLHNDPWELGKNHYGEVAVLGDIKATLPVLNRHVHEHPKRSAAGAERRNQRLRTLHDQRTKDWEQFGKAVQSVPGKELVPPSLVAVTLREIQDEVGKDGWTLSFVNEAISASKSFQQFLAYHAPISYYATEGGSLGYSMPASIGISEALRKREPKRIVVNAVGDGSALFYPQVWWTIAKDGLPVLTIVMNNRRYQTLISGLDEIEKLYRWKPSGPTDYLYLRKPEIKFVDVARTYGIEHGDTITRASELKPKLQKAIEVVQAGSPYVLDVLVAPADPKPAPRLDVFVASLEGKR